MAVLDSTKTLDLESRFYIFPSRVVQLAARASFPPHLLTARQEGKKENLYHSSRRSACEAVRGSERHEKKEKNG